jgi:polyhydroxybutyrate depolymerase
VIIGRPAHTILAAALLIAVAVLPGCGRGPTRSTPAAASASGTLQVDGETRTYRLHRPDELPDAPALVVVVHGGGGSGRQAERSYGWDALADDEGFLVAYPDGLNRTWNAGGGCCGQAAADDVDDVAFLEALVTELSDNAGVDPDRVFITGMSNGAMMAYALACASDVVAAIAPVAGTMLADCPDPDPVSLLHIHGTADSLVPLDGSRGEGPVHVDGPPITTVIDRWRSVDDCTPATVTTVGPVQHSFAGCAEGREVQLTTIDGAGHQWPGADVARNESDPPSTALDATATIWRFFEANPRP